MNKRCWVYFAKSETTGLIKIGFSTQPRRRLSILRCRQHEEINLLGIVPGSRELEKVLHEQLKDSQERGEWFRPTTELITFIEQLEKVPVPKGEKPIRRKVFEGPEYLLDQYRLADRLNVTPKTALKYMRSGTIPSRMEGDTLVTTVQDVERCLFQTRYQRTDQPAE